MGKRNSRENKPVPGPGVSDRSALSAAGRRVIPAGICLLAAGFFILSKADPAGKNWAALVSPFMILGAYAVIALGIMSD